MKRKIDQVSNTSLAGPLKLPNVPFDYPSLCGDMAEYIRSLLSDSEDWSTLICLTLTCHSEYNLRRSFSDLKRDFLEAVCCAGHIQLHNQLLKGSILSNYMFNNTVDSDILYAAWNNQFEMVKYLHNLKIQQFASICQESSLAIVGAAHCENREMMTYLIDLNYKLDDISLVEIISFLPNQEIRPFMMEMCRIRGNSGYSIGTLCLPILLDLDHEWATQLWYENYGCFDYEFTDKVIETQHYSTVRQILQSVVSIMRFQNNIIPELVGKHTFKVAAATGDIKKMQLVVGLNRFLHVIPVDVILATASHGDKEFLEYVLNFPAFGLAITYNPLMILTVIAASGNTETFKWFDRKVAVLVPNYKNFSLITEIHPDYSTIMVGAIRSENWDMIRLVDSLGLFNTPKSDSIAYMAAVRHVDNSVLDWLYDIKKLRWSDAAFVGLFNFKFWQNELTSERLVEVLKWLMARKFDWMNVGDFYQLLHLNPTSKYYKVKMWMEKQPYFEKIFATPINTVEDSMEKAFRFYDSIEYKTHPNLYEALYARTLFLWTGQI